jgi:hypothetical protein
MIPFGEIAEIGDIDDRLRGWPFVGDMWQPFYVTVDSTRHWFSVRGPHSPDARLARHTEWLAKLAEFTALSPRHEIRR